MSIYVPQPRYSPEHKQQASREAAPLFTLDIHWPGDRRCTTTGVLCEISGREMIERIERAIAQIAKSPRVEKEGTK